MRCHSVVAGLRRRGHEVHVLTSSYHGSNPATSDKHVTRALQLTWGPPYPAEDLPGWLLGEAVDRLSLQTVLRAVEPDVMDIWGMEFASLSLVAAGLEVGVATHLTLEDVWWASGYQRDPLCALTSIARRLAVPMPGSIAELCCLGLERPARGNATWHFVSRALAQRYVEAGCENADRVRIAGIDLSPFHHQPAPSVPPPFVIVSVGQLTAARGQADLIAAAGRLVTEDSCLTPLVVRFVGEGNATYRDQLHSLAAGLASDRLRFDFAGVQSPERVASFYAGAHLFVHTSHLPEGLPRVLMEALAAGVPAIATNTGGQRDILADGRWGELLPAANITALVEAIRDAMANWSSWRNRAREAREYALRHYDLEAYVDGHIEDLADTIDSTPQRGGLNVAGTDASISEIKTFTAALGQGAERAADSSDAASDPDLAWRLGVVLKRTGRLNTAERLLMQLYQSHSEEAVHIRRSAFHLAELAMVREDWRVAAEFLDSCLAVAPSHEKATYDQWHVARKRAADHLKALRSPRLIGMRV
ncbi:MAG: glycosyltransferase family 4 protein [Planctomycetota bacterium]